MTMLAGWLLDPSTHTTTGTVAPPKGWVTRNWICAWPLAAGAIPITCMGTPDAATCRRPGLFNTLGSRPTTITFNTSPAPAESDGGFPVSGALDALVTCTIVGGALSICTMIG